jgi:hypothetical protein
MKKPRLPAALALALVASTPALAVVPADGDPILFWNQTALPLSTGGYAQMRAFALANTAMHDAVNHTLGKPNYSYLKGVKAPGGNERAAAAKAAHDVFASLFPASAGAYGAALAASLAAIPDGQAKADGIATGAAYAAAILAARTGDTPPPLAYVPTGLPGDWKPTPPGFAPAAGPQWAGATPFLLASQDQFRPGPPPALDSAEYSAAYAEVASLGAVASATRTADQTLSAQFWGNAQPSTWLSLSLPIAENEPLSTLEFAQLYARLAVSSYDAFIAQWDAKYEYRLWRPVTAIREGDTDGNPDTVGDPGWTPLNIAPPHPAYVSGNSNWSALSSAILIEALGDEAFCGTIGPNTRCFTGLAAAAEDGALSRLWGGIHWRFDSEAGLAMGADIAAWTLAQKPFGAVPEPATWAMLVAGFGIVGAAARTRRSANPQRTLRT